MQISTRCIGSYVISMTHSASHIMEVMFLAYLAGLAATTALATSLEPMIEALTLGTPAA